MTSRSQLTAGWPSVTETKTGRAAHRPKSTGQTHRMAFICLNLPSLQNFWDFSTTKPLRIFATTSS